MNYNTPEKNYYVNKCDDLVIWSGGIDSTYLLNDLLKSASSNNPVGALSINHYFLAEGKVNGEEIARNKFIKHVIEKNKYPFVYDYIKFGSHTQHEVYQGMGQITTWIMYAHSIAGRDSTIHLGVLRGDDQTRFVDKLHELVGLLNHMTDKNVKLSFPLIPYHKLHMMKLVFDEGIENYTWVCELPTKKGKTYHQCGGTQCDSCKEHIRNLLLFRMSLTNEEYLARVDKHLKLCFNIEFKNYEQFSESVGDFFLSHKI